MMRSMALEFKKGRNCWNENGSATDKQVVREYKIGYNQINAFRERGE